MSKTPHEGNEDWGIVIQARLGSTRLPGKMIIPFFENKSLLTLVLEKLCATFPAERLLLATSTDPRDEAIAELAAKSGVACFRGSENDVLDRFISAAKWKGWKSVIRICADNPFLYPEYTSQLAAYAAENPADYISWFFSDGTPVIRSHSGFFAEWISLAALEKTAASSTEKIYREHVTNYIYEHAADFKIERIRLNDESFFRSVRLTIDTQEDYNLAKNMYEELVRSGRPISPATVKEYITAYPAVADQMRTNILSNAK